MMGISALSVSVPPDLREAEPRQAVLDTVRVHARCLFWLFL